MNKNSKTPYELELSVTDAHLIELISDMPIQDKKKLIKKLEEKYAKGKRKSVRVRYFSDVDFATKYQAYKGFIQNFSDHGMLIETRGSFRVGQKITMSFVLPYSDEQVKMAGEIVRVESEGKFAVQFNLEDNKHSE